MTMDVEIALNPNFVYLLDQIRANFLTGADHEATTETPRAHAWLLTTLAIYGEDLSILIELYRVFREQNSYSLLSFIIEHILQHHSNEIDKIDYLQQEFQSIFGKSSDNTFSYSRLNSILSLKARELISAFLIRKWYHELEKHLLLSSTSVESLNHCREKSLACLSLSSTSVSSIFDLILSSEDKIGFNTKFTSLNLLRCLFVQDLLPVVLENRQQYGAQAHSCHKWLICAIEFYLEYAVKCRNNDRNQVLLEGNLHRTFQCKDPIEQFEKLLNLAINMQENFNWQQFIIHQGNQSGSLNRRQKLLELRILVDRAHNSSIRCPLECLLFCTSFPIYVQSVLNLSMLLNKEPYRDYIFIYGTASIAALVKKSNETYNLELTENFSLFVDCLNLLQQSQTSSCVKIYQETIDKIQLNANIPNYQRLLRIFYVYYAIQQSKGGKEGTNENKPIVIDDTPQSPTMQDETNSETSSPSVTSPLLAPNIESLIQQLNDDSLESRLQLCSLYSIAHSTAQIRSTVSFCIDTLIYLHERSTSYDQQQTLLPLSSDYCLIPRSYKIFFDYIIDILLQYLPSTLVLLQLGHQRSSSMYPKDLLQTISPPFLRYIYDQKLLGQLIKYIQTTTASERRWTANTNKRKHNNDETNKLTDEQFIEKIIQHASSIAQWTDEQRRSAIYSYLIEERQVLLQAL
ncbi:unnamed protein product [Adineta ricciae]|uniref:Uncharacterized protein n=2 Tax=Adineta ricciae TaxID=249248 RepID=A0A814AKH0_ADIRI|nr:unnamed protein product [Adineta ricciae]